MYSRVLLADVGQISCKIDYLYVGVGVGSAANADGIKVRCTEF